MGLLTMFNLPFRSKSFPPSKTSRPFYKISDRFSVEGDIAIWKQALLTHEPTRSKKVKGIICFPWQNPLKLKGAL